MKIGGGEEPVVAEMNAATLPHVPMEAYVKDNYEDIFYNYNNNYSHAMYDADTSLFQRFEYSNCLQ